jgi:hypothetical protein
MPSSTMLSFIILLMGEWLPPSPENLRGTLLWSYDERVETFAMYEESSKKALRDVREYITKMNVKLPLYEDRSKASEHGQPAPLVCVGILTARRIGSERSYLLQLVGSLLARMDLLAPDDFYIHIFNVDKEPEQHTEVYEISDLLPVSIIKLTHASGLNAKQVESLDYAEALRLFGKIGCQNQLMLEDDAFASDKWTSQVREALNQLEGIPDWFLVRLYTSRSTARTPRGDQQLYFYDPKYGGVACLINGRYTYQFASALEQQVLDNKELIPKDLYMSVFGSEIELPIMSFEPVVFQHTGLHSTVNKRNLSSHFPPYMCARNFVSENQPVVFCPM